MSEYVTDTKGNVREKVVRCEDCAKSHMAGEVRVCGRFGCFNHTTEDDGFCAWGEARG